MIVTECHLYGEMFSPKMLSGITGIIIKKSNEVGEIAEIGRYKNQPLPYGACNITIPDNIEVKDRIEWMADFIYDNIEIFKQAGATDIVFWIYWTGMQGNMEFTVSELGKIAKLKIPLCIDYIFQDDETIK